jgi:hypothetical protein
MCRINSVCFHFFEVNLQGKILVVQMGVLIGASVEKSRHEAGHQLFRQHKLLGSKTPCS